MNKELDHDLINADILWVGEVHGIKEPARGGGLGVILFNQRLCPWQRRK